jgi:predicted nucleic acid-binding protein
MMTKPNRFSAQDISSLKDKSIFFDANVIMYIFWPLYPGSHYTQEYSTIFGSLLKQGNALKLNSVVLSEVINRVARLEYDKYKNANNTSIHFKEYRDLEEGRSVFQDIYNIIKNEILNVFGFCDKSFTVDDIKALLQVDNTDFNDKLIIEACKENGCLLLTNDSDFKDSDIDILTVNNKLLTV